MSLQRLSRLIISMSLVSLTTPSLCPVSSAAPGSELPPPPEIIAPNQLIRPEEVNLEPEQARQRELEYKRDADRAYAHADYPNTLIALQRAYLVSKNPRYIANQGLVLEKLGRYEEAVQALEYFLLTKPSEKKEAAARKVIMSLRPEVKIITDPVGAQVIIDGASQADLKTPTSLKLIAGKHLLELRLKGYEKLKTNLFVEVGKPTTAQYTLQLDTRAIIEEEEKRAQIDKTFKLPPMNTAQASSLTVGAVSLGIGAVSLWMSRDAIIERDMARSQATWSAAQREASALGGLGYGAASIGLTALIGGVTWWLLSDPGATPRSQLKKSVSLSGSSSPQARYP